jgi:hypothetical protein
MIMTKMKAVPVYGRRELTTKIEAPKYVRDVPSPPPKKVTVEFRELTVRTEAPMYVRDVPSPPPKKVTVEFRELTVRTEAPMYVRDLPPIPCYSRELLPEPIVKTKRKGNATRRQA